jgi:hypothetical protein
MTFAIRLGQQRMLSVNKCCTLQCTRALTKRLEALVLKLAPEDQANGIDSIEANLENMCPYFKTWMKCLVEERMYGLVVLFFQICRTTMYVSLKTKKIKAIQQCLIKSH